jgi:hypothetical protein
MMDFFKIYFLYYPIFWAGYLLFKITGTTNWYPYVSFRRLFVFTRGASNDKMSARLSRQHPAIPMAKAKGILGELKTDKVNAIVDAIKKDGYYVFNEKLSDSSIDELTAFAMRTEANLVPPAKDGTKRSLYDRTHVVSPRYEFDEQAILSDGLIQRITCDRSLFAIAQGYLNCNPIQDLTAMWWSAAFSKEASSEAAQLYHFDMDRFKFIKFFFYLTDVDSHNGPHCFIRGSHKWLPDLVRKDGRIPDDEVRKSFSENDILEIEGKRGTILAVDTRGLHKGKVLERGERLLLQVEFTNSLFGAPYNEIDVSKNCIPELKELITKNKHSFQRFKS